MSGWKELLLSLLLSVAVIAELPTSSSGAMTI
jgi:hypothetical protein